MAHKAEGAPVGGLRLVLDSSLVLDPSLVFDSSLALPKKHSLTIAGHRTSITLEDAFWRALKTAAAEMDVSVTALVSAIDKSRGAASLSAAIRVFLLSHRTTEKPLAPDGV